MGLPQLQTACFVLDLKTGNIVMGCFNGVLSFTMLVAMSVAAAVIGEDKDVTLMGVEEMAEMTGFYAMSVILVFMFLFKFIFDIVFVYGVVMERAGIIKAYCIMWIVFFLLSSFVFFINVMKYSGFTIFVELLYLSVNVYAILLSNSFYKMLNEREVL